MVLVSALVIGGALRVWLSFTDDGIYWPDEIYQALEPAHRAIFGYGLIAWEFIEGARNWTFPGLVAGMLKLCALLGLTDPRQYLSFVRLAFSAISIATAFGTYLLCRRLGARPLFAACGAAVFALAGPIIYFAPRSFAENASALLVVFGVANALPDSLSRTRRFIGAALLGLATLIRLQNGLFCVGLILGFTARRRWEALRDVSATFAASAALFGLIDKLTWGTWFKSAIIYVRFNWFLGGEPITGNSGTMYYVDMLMRSMPLVTLGLFALCVIALFRSRELAFITLLFFVVHVLIANKAYRYILPALPLFCAMAGIGLEVLSRSRRQLAVGLGVVLVTASLWSGVHFRQLTFGEIGPYEKTRPFESAYDNNGSVNRLLITAGRQPDLCGVKVETDELVWIGGYTYLHRDVPLYSMTGPNRNSERYNYVITGANDSRDEPIAVDGIYALRRLNVKVCAPDPGYDYRLPGADEIHRMLAL